MPGGNHDNTFREKALRFWQKFWTGGDLYMSIYGNFIPGLCTTVSH